VTRRVLARRLAGVAFSVGLVLGSLELALRLAPGLVGGRLANAVYSVYGPAGIYFQDRPLHMNFMWPNFETLAYWNGYWWHHRTDAAGFRNPPDLAAKSLLLLGDSLIYGHGAEEQDTAAHLLRARYGRPAYNMGRQGDCLYQEYVLSRLYLPLLHPETVVLFVFLNDFRDLEVYRQPAEIADPPELDRIDYDALRARVEHPEQRWRLRDQLARLRVWRLAGGIADSMRARPTPADEAHEMMAPIFEDARYEPIARYYRLVLADLARRTREQGAELVVVLLELPDAVVANATAAQQRLLALLDEIGAQEQFRVLGTGAILRDCADCELPNDGHLAPEGHRRLAEFIDAQIPPRRDRTGAAGARGAASP
jgi:hypothetical protein